MEILRQPFYNWQLMTTDHRGQIPLQTEMHAQYLEIIDNGGLSTKDRIGLASWDIGDHAEHVAELVKEAKKSTRLALVWTALRTPDLLTRRTAEEASVQKASLQQQLKMARLAHRSEFEGVRAVHKLPPRHIKKAIKRRRQSRR